MEQPKAMEYGNQKASPDVLKPHTHTHTHTHTYICIYIYISLSGAMENTSVLGNFLTSMFGALIYIKSLHSKL